MSSMKTVTMLGRSAADSVEQCRTSISAQNAIRETDMSFVFSYERTNQECPNEVGHGCQDCTLAQRADSMSAWGKALGSEIEIVTKPQGGGSMSKHLSVASPLRGFENSFIT